MKHEEFPLLEKNRWTRAENYAGPTFYDWYVVVAQHRDSGLIDRANFAVASETLTELAEEINPDTTDEQVLVVRNGHWAVGWLEFLAVHEDADTAILETAETMLEALDNYPILCEIRFGNMEMEEAQETWESLDLRERIELCNDSNYTFFAARHDELPNEVYTELTERYIQY